MADLQVKTANICNITSSTLLRPNAGGSGTYISDNTISVHMTNQHRASGIYISSLPEQSVIGDKYTISFVPVCTTNNVMLVVLYGTTTQISFTSGNRYTLTITATAADNTMAFYGGDTVEKTIIIKDIQIEKGETATVYRPYSATSWVHSLRKLTTATDTITTLPVDLYADGTNATVGLVGNMSQTGTPTPQNPIQPSETGERTANLLNTSDILYDTQFDTTPNPPAFVYSDTLNCSNYIPVSSGTYLRTLNNVAIGNWFYEFDANKNYLRTKTPGEGAPMEISIDASYIVFNISKTVDITKYMFSRTSTALPYEPYGYKIPISSANTTTPVYLGEVESTRRIKKLVLTGGTDEEYVYDAPYTRFYFTISNILGIGVRLTPLYCTHYQNISDGRPVGDVPNNSIYTGGGIDVDKVFIKTTDYTSAADFKSYLAQQYANGTPVTVWYVLATPETAVVNEPLRKIGDYADTVSGITIPTITGADSFDVLATLKPSEVELTYTGWHDATVKEKSRNLFDYFISGIAIDTNTGAETPSDSGFTSDFIAVDNNAIYSYSGGNDTISTCFFAYDSSKAYIGRSTNVRISSAAIKTVTTATSGYQVFANSLTGNTNPIAYIRVGHLSGTQAAVDSETIMLNTGSTALPYEPYWK